MRSRRVVACIILAAQTILATPASPAPIWGPPRFPSLCKRSASLEAADRHRKGFSPADEFFISGERPKAFRAYYQMFYCTSSPLFVNMDPRTEYFGGHAALEQALVRAINGHYEAASALLLPPVHNDSGFGLGKFMLGQFSWAAGNKQRARKYWRDAVRTYGYTMPWHRDERPPDFSEAASKMLATLE